MSAPPKTEAVKISDVKQDLSALVDRIARNESRVLIERSGKPVAAIVSAQDLQRLEQFDRERAERFAILDEIGEAFKDVPVEELEREVANAVAEVRAERRAEAQQPVVAGM